MTASSIVLIMLGGVSAIAAAVTISPTPWLIWNASDSVPVGLYVTSAVDTLDIGDLVVVRAPRSVADFMATRGILPHGVPLLKRVAALQGQVVCRSDTEITVDRVAIGKALTSDSIGRPLPVWSGCQIVGPGTIFLMNWQSVDSFDGRYFGLLPTSAVIARASPVWTFDDEGE